MTVKHLFRQATASVVGGLLVLAASSAASASTYNAVVVYGDSLSDNGNFYNAVGGIFPPTPPYALGRRSDGPLAVEYLASQFHVPLIDLAWIGATTGIGNYADGGTVTSPGFAPLPGMSSVFAATGAYRAPFLSDGLFVVWGGPNDVLAPSPLDVSQGLVNPAGVIGRAVGNLLGIVGQLQAEGAQNILVPGMPDLGLTPYFRGMGFAAAAQASAFTDAFNAALLAGLPTGAMYYDTAGFLREVDADPQAYGLSDVSDPCFDSEQFLDGLALKAPYTICGNSRNYLFFDSFHPGTVANALLADAFVERVPEPASISLLGLALGLLGGVWRRRQPAA